MVFNEAICGSQTCLHVRLTWREGFPSMQKVLGSVLSTTKTKNKTTEVLLESPAELWDDTCPQAKLRLQPVNSEHLGCDGHGYVISLSSRLHSEAKGENH